MQKKLTEQVDKKLIGELADLLSKQIQDELHIEVGNMEVWPIAQKVAQAVGTRFFNLGVAAAREALDKRHQDMQLDLDLLEER